MSEAQPVAFSRFGAFALIAVGFALFVALIWLIAEGEDFGGSGNTGAANASSNGLNGYSGLVRLVKAEGFEADRSRNPSDLETYDLLVLAPPQFTDPEEFAALLKKREQFGPTLVILPKWDASPPPIDLPQKVRAKFKPGWVTLGQAFANEWTAKLPAPYTVKHTLEQLKKDEAPNWEGLGEAGRMPTRTIVYGEDDPQHEAMITDAAGHALAVKIVGEEGSTYYEEAHWTVFVTDADLVNNYGLADANRAAAAIALINDLTYDGDITGVTFDMTLNGFGASENLLTLAFRPPFLAATLCLIMALVIIGWRAFQRFGPAAAAGGPAIAFGKQRLIANGAGLILRARRLRLLGAPYAALSARRVAEKLGLARHDREAIDAALARRLPNEEPFTRRAARMEGASKPAEILSAARALDDLNTKLSQGK